MLKIVCFRFSVTVVSFSDNNGLLADASYRMYSYIHTKTLGALPLSFFAHFHEQLNIVWSEIIWSKNDYTSKRFFRKNPPWPRDRVSVSYCSQVRVPSNAHLELVHVISLWGKPSLSLMRWEVFRVEYSSSSSEYYSILISGCSPSSEELSLFPLSFFHALIGYIG